MVARLNLNNAVKNSNEDTPRLHWMPCVIKTNGKANVSKYFEPLIAKRDDGVFGASFRGRPLLGREVRLPDNYTGVVVVQTSESLDENADRNLYGVTSFDRFTYWNWDVEPTGNDKVVLAMDWFEIAEALHSPISS